MAANRIFFPFCLLALLSGCQSLQQVDQSLYSVADTVARPDAVTGQRSLNIRGRQEQIQTGNQYAMEAIRPYGGNINEKVDAAAYARLKRVFERIHAVTQYRDEKWEVVLVPDESFNAFATGGTIVVVHKGFMDAIKDDDGVAAVLGHEIGHITANHIFEREALMITQIRKSAAKAQGFQTAFTVDQEREADRIGILYAALAGYDPYASASIWEQMYRQEGNNAAMLSDHPINSERAAAARKVADAVKQYYMPGRINPNFAAILEDNVLWSKSQADLGLQAGQGGGLVAAATAALNTYGQLQQAKQEQAQQLARVSSVRQVSQQLGVLQMGRVSETAYAVKIRYNGDRPLKNLVLKAPYGGQTLIYHSSGVIPPGGVFDAVFDAKTPLDESKIQQRIGIDSVQLAQ